MSISIESFPETYVPNTEIQFRGSVSDEIQNVDLYVRDRGNWHRLARGLSVSDNSFEEGNIVLNEKEDVLNLGGIPEAANILNIPGMYEIGVVDSDEVESDDEFLSRIQFKRAESDRQSIRVTEPYLEGRFVTYNGEIFVEDGIEYEARGIGTGDVIIILVDRYGEVLLEIGENNDGEISGKIDLSEAETLSGRQLSKGGISGNILSPGRDQVFGDGSYKLPENLTHTRDGERVDTADEWISTEARNMETVLIAIQNENDTKNRIANKIYELTIDNAGSDDLVVGEEFLIRGESGTRVTGIYPEQYDPEGIHIHRMEVNETMVVEGVTNRSPENSITVDLVRRSGNYVGSVDPIVVDDWGG